MVMKKRTWLYIGHDKGKKQKDRALGSTRFVPNKSAKQAIREIRRDNQHLTITRVK